MEAGTLPKNDKMGAKNTWTSPKETSYFVKRIFWFKHPLIWVQIYLVKEMTLFGADQLSYDITDL